MADTKIHGLDAIKRKLEKLPERLGNNAGRRALRKGANVFRDAARVNAKKIDDPETREQIFKNISVASGGSKREKRVGGVLMRVGVRGGAKQYVQSKDNVRSGRAGKSYQVGGSSSNPGGDTWHWRLVEFGTSQSRAQPFMRPAMQSAAGKAAEVAIAALNKEFDKELAKL